MQTRSLGRNKGWQWQQQTNFECPTTELVLSILRSRLRALARSTSITRKCLLISKSCELSAQGLGGNGRRVEQHVFHKRSAAALCSPGRDWDSEIDLSVSGKAMNSHIRGPIQQGLHPVSRFRLLVYQKQRRSSVNRSTLRSR